MEELERLINTPVTYFRICPVCGNISGCDRGMCGRCLCNRVCGFRNLNLPRTMEVICTTCDRDHKLHEYYNRPRPKLTKKQRKRRRR